jgi:hypothetical protein
MIAKTSNNSQCQRQTIQPLQNCCPTPVVVQSQSCNDNKMCVPKGGIMVSDGNCGTNAMFPTKENQVPISVKNADGSFSLDFGDMVSGGSSSTQIQSDWNQTVTTALDYIKNKPTIPTAWTCNDTRNCLGITNTTNGKMLLVNGVISYVADTATTVSNSIVAGALTTTVNGVTSTPVTLPVPTPLTPTAVASLLNNNATAANGSYSISIVGGVPTLVTALSGGGTETSITANNSSTVALTASGTANHTLVASLVGASTATIGQVPTSNGTGGITWTTPVASTNGTVTSVSASGGTTGLTFFGSPITTSGTLTLGGILGTTNGGTGLSTLGTAGQVLTVNPAGTGLVYSTPSAVSGANLTTSTTGLTLNGGTTATGATLIAATVNYNLVTGIGGLTAGTPAVYGTTLVVGADGQTHLLPTLPAASTGTTNLSYTASPTNGIVVSDTGNDATIPLVTATNAGLATPLMLANDHPAMTTTDGASVDFTTNVATQVVTAEVSGYTAATVGQIPTKSATGITWVNAPTQLSFTNGINSVLTGSGTAALPYQYDVALPFNLDLEVGGGFFTAVNQPSKPKAFPLTKSVGTITKAIFQLTAEQVDAATPLSDNALVATSASLMKGATVLATGVIPVGSRSISVTVTGATFNSGDDLTLRYNSGDTDKMISVSFAGTQA